MAENDAATNDQLAIIVASLNALRVSVEGLKNSTEASQRDIDRLRCQMNADINNTEAIEEVATVPARNETPLIPETNQSALVAQGELKMKLYDLPTFSGNAEEWPLFSANYKDTTDAFHYNDRQNLMRLRKCLTGAAKDAVASMLIFPSDVSNVMEELEFRFGRPDLLVRHQINRIQQFPNIPESKLDQVMQFSTQVRNVVSLMTSANCQQHLSNTTLLEQLVAKLPNSKQFEWTKYAINVKPFPTLKEFSEWLSDFARIVCLMPPPARGHHVVAQPPPPRRVMHVYDTPSQSWARQDSLPRKSPQRQSLPRQDATPRQDVASALKCYECGNAHLITDCNVFNQSLDVPSRWERVKVLRLCFSCLRKGHNTASCRSKRVCDVNGCRRHHHRLLHDASLPAVAPPSVMMAPNDAAETMLSCRPSQSTSGQLFKILPVSLFGPNGKMDVFAMFDEGSAISLLEEGVASKLGLKGKSQPLTLQWYGQKRTTEPSSKVNLEIQGHDELAKYPIKNVRTIQNLNLPVQSLEKSKFGHFEFLSLKDYSAVKPVILLGLDNSYLGVSSAVVEGDEVSPVAAKTKLGWVAYGPTKSSTPSSPVVLHISEDPLHQAVIEFFVADNFGVSNTTLLEADDDINARRILEESTRRIGKRFECGLLWKIFPPALPDSYDMARNRLLSIEKKMRNNEDFAIRYKAEMQKYFDKGYARALSADEINNVSDPIWYLPHFAVHNPHKPEKMRIVFDAAAIAHGTSLNSALLKGPEQARPLLSVLFRFREGVIGVAADICEMFSQIHIKPNDQHAQRFLWRNGDANQPIQQFAMVSMIFGAICSPCCAEFVKNKNAEEFMQQFPNAASAIIQKHYVDDFVASFHDEKEADRICQQVVYIHAQAGFNLRKFVSNSARLRAVNEGTSSTPNTISMECQATTEKVLGMYWNTTADVFQFRCKFHRIPQAVLEGYRPPTKRELLGIVMSVFDPFGLLADFLLFSKTLIQETWRSKIGWDDPLPNEIFKRWSAWWKEFKRVDEFEISRCYSPNIPSAITIELHVVVDASQVAFAAAAYFRIVHTSGTDVAFVAGKTRGAPQKVMSIPRLELQAAVLGTRLSKLIRRSHEVQIEQTIFWTDSQTLLHWINSTQRKFKAFVGHRIAEILTTTKPSQWRWIPTDKNTADVATRPKWPPKFLTQSPWVVGPEFLRQPEVYWPTAHVTMLPDHLEEEIKQCLVIQPEVSDTLFETNRFSSYLKLKRVIAWVFRATSKFCSKLKAHCSPTSENGPLTVAEIGKAENYICKTAQADCYAQEINDLRSSKPVCKSSSIYALTPYLDKDGVLRIQGRIDAAQVLPFEARRPILLPPKHAISELVMKHYHEKFHHQNKAVTINEARQKFWFPHAKSLLRSIERRCCRCEIDKAKPKPPLMGQLPPDRLTPFVRPFTYTGVDLFGPLNVAVARRREKRWAVIFTCLTTRAAHLELTENLSTDAFMLCLRNFVNRRGTPVRIRSDNGTNFIGAQKELKEAERILDVDRIANEATSRGIEWLFNCPLNPSSGGCWERLIKIVKRLLQKTLHEEAPRVETLRSLLIEAENIINARPLTDIPLSSEDDEPLTPNHFLMGGVNSTQTPQPADEPICLKKQWRIAQNLKDRLWKRWVNEYLPQLLLRPKWYDKVTPLKVNDLVLICDSSQPRSQWRKGRVTKVYPAKDGQIRFAEVKTATGLTRRPATKLAVLHIEGESRSDSQGGECKGTLYQH